MLLEKPELNLFAGWQYLLSRGYREQTQREWQNLPWWVVALQFVSGTCSVLFPGIILALVSYVVITRQFL
ncbi:MAG: hypothetical protein C0631_06440 [Sedimenticola sp.]|nr:MAG: hypothetical protein C0631_06440 [Sedimenticola sp.]